MKHKKKKKNTEREINLHSFESMPSFFILFSNQSYLNVQHYIFDISHDHYQFDVILVIAAAMITVPMKIEKTNYYLESLLSFFLYSYSQLFRWVATILHASIGNILNSALFYQASGDIVLVIPFVISFIHIFR